MTRMLTSIRSIDRWRSILAGAATVALALVTVQAAPAAADAAPVTQTFTCTGSEWAFPVPDGVTSLQVVAIGAPGATLSVGPNTGGRSAQVTADVGVTPGQLLQVNVGCPGSGAAGGFNGGGTANSALHGGAGAGGGGASDIRTISRFGTGSLDSRLIVAGGGGGEGGTNEFGNSTSGGAGGNAGADGGNAGGTTNSRGRTGTLTAGGAGGSATGTAQQGDPQPGFPGQAGTGGNGGAYGVNTPGRGGGGGGGGLFGGGGGGGGGLGDSNSYGGGGGGGGSSLVPAGGTLTVAPAGTAPSVTITYVPPEPPPAQCADGEDNDGDGLIDFPEDPGCTDPDDDRELDPTGNDDFQDAELLTGSSASATGSNVDASMQAGEPDHRNGQGSHSIWYRWTAPGSGSTTIELCGSDFDTVLAVYTGSAVDALTEVVDNDDSGDTECGNLNSRVVFDAAEGVTYHIAVDGYGDNTGNVVLTLSGPSAPADTRFEEDHAALAYSLRWTHPADTRRSAGAGMVSSRPGDTMEVIFTGPDVRWITTTHHTRGIAQIEIDGVDHGTVDTSGPTAFQVPVFTASGLGEGPHTLRITNTGTAHPDATDTRIEIDAIEAAGVVALPRVEEDHAALAYALRWTHPADTRRSAGAGMVSTAAGAAMEVVFTGPDVRWITTTHSTRGIAQIHIDGVDHGTVDTSGPTAFQVPVFTATGLGEGPHTLRITNTGTAHPDATDTRIEIDAIEAAGVVAPAP